MADIHIHRSHGLGLAKARKIAWKWAEAAEEKFGMECTVIEGEDERRRRVHRAPASTAGCSSTPIAFDLDARLGFLLR